MTPKVSKLSNGIVVATENIPDANSACVGIWLDVGSRDETKTNNGISHLFEHMVFKGTGKRSGLEIVQSLEAKGGQVNAFTTKEQTCFYAKVVSNEVSLAVDVLLDMVLDAKFDPEELNKEREVVIEELKGSDDNPDERVYDLFGPALFGKNSLGYPIAGTVSTVKKLSRPHLMRHLDKVRNKLPVYVVAVGKVNHREIELSVKEISKKFLKSPSQIRRRPLGRIFKNQKKKHLQENKDIYQANVMLGGPSFAVTDARCFGQSALNCVLGDGMSSRLFQRIREEYGYVYHISTYSEALVNAGLFGITFSTEPKYLKKCMELVNEEMSNLKDEGITKDELEFAKENLKGTFLLEMESFHTRMSFLAKVMMYGKPIKSTKQYLAKIDNIKKHHVDDVIKTLLRSELWGSAAVLPKGTRVNFEKLLSF